MGSSTNPSKPRYRVWITLLEGEVPPSEGQSPLALEPAEKGTMSARQAARYVAAFNRTAAVHHRRVRAVALPVAVRYEGDAVPGEPFHGSRKERIER